MVLLILTFRIISIIQAIHLSEQPPDQTKGVQITENALHHIDGKIMSKFLPAIDWVHFTGHASSVRA